MKTSPYKVKLFDTSLPERRFSIVVLPHPDGPTTAVNVLGENFPEHGFRIFLTAGTVETPPFSFVTYFSTSART